MAIDCCLKSKNVRLEDGLVNKDDYASSAGMLERHNIFIRSARPVFHIDTISLASCFCNG